MRELYWTQQYPVACIRSFCNLLQMRIYRWLIIEKYFTLVKCHIPLLRLQPDLLTDCFIFVKLQVWVLKNWFRINITCLSLFNCRVVLQLTINLIIKFNVEHICFKFIQLVSWIRTQNNQTSLLLISQSCYQIHWVNLRVCL